MFTFCKIQIRPNDVFNDLNYHYNIPSSTVITADIGNGNYRCSSASDDIGQYRPDIAVLPGIFLSFLN